jgi:sn-glycerol 3-phosphate transport system substrate-binding protein
VPAVAGYYTAPNGQMLSFPFNSSTPVFHYNKDAFKAAGLTPRSRPRPGPKWRWPPPSSRPAATSARSPPAGRAGRSWRASRPGTTSSSPPSGNGFGGLDTRLAFNTPLHVRHIENLANMAKQGLFVYKGRGNAADATFVSGECAMATGSSALYGSVKRNAKFASGISHPALLPRRARRAAEHRDRRRQPVGDVGKKPAEYKGVAAVLRYLSKPEVAAKSHQRTGYLPVTKPRRSS